MSLSRPPYEQGEKGGEKKLQHYSFHKQTEPYLKSMTNTTIPVHHTNSFALPLLPINHTV